MSYEKDKAVEIMSLYRPIINNSMSKECAIIHVKGIIEELEIIEISKLPHNLNYRVWFWNQVLMELSQM